MKKLKYILCIALLSLSITTIAQYQWAQRVGSNSFDYASPSIIVDNFGNVYSAGIFTGNDCFFENDTLNLVGNSDFFLSKHDANGNEIWVKRIGGNNSSLYSEGIGGICFDPTQSFIYITGSFSGTSDFGGVSLTCSGQCLFLAKIDLNGNCIWAKKNTGGLYSTGTGVIVDNVGDIFLCGTNSHLINVDTLSIPAGGFIARFDSNGNCIWIKNKFRYMNITNCEATPEDIKFYGSNIIVYGSATNDTVIVDSLIAISSTGANTAYIASFDLNGNVVWLKLLGGGANGGSSFTFSIDNSGNSYVSGVFTSTGIFGTTILNNGTQDDAFIAKYDINGNFKWVKQINATAGAWGWGLYTFPNGTSYVVGRFSGSASFGIYNIIASTSQDMFLARYDSLGNCIGVKNFGKAYGASVYSNDINSFYISGSFYNTVNIGSNTFASYGQNDIFIAKGDAITGIVNRTTNVMSELLIYANPNKGTCTIKVPEDIKNENDLVLTIYDFTGKIIQQTPLQINEEKIKINIESEASGIYNVTLGNKNKMYSGKIVFE